MEYLINNVIQHHNWYNIWLYILNDRAVRRLWIESKFRDFFPPLFPLSCVSIFFGTGDSIPYPCQLSVFFKINEFWSLHTVVDPPVSSLILHPGWRRVNRTLFSLALIAYDDRFFPVISARSTNVNCWPETVLFTPQLRKSSCEHKLCRQNRNGSFRKDGML